MLPGTCCFDWGPDNSIYCHASRRLTGLNRLESRGSILRVTSVEDWNSFFSKSIKEKIRGDLKTVFDDDFSNYEDNIRHLNSNLGELMEADFLKFVGDRQGKMESIVKKL